MIVQLSHARRFLVDDLLCVFNCTTVLEVRGGSGCPEVGQPVVFSIPACRTRRLKVASTCAATKTPRQAPLAIHEMTGFYKRTV